MVYYHHPIQLKIPSIQLKQRPSLTTQHEEEERIRKIPEQRKDIRNESARWQELSSDIRNGMAKRYLSRWKREWEIGLHPSGITNRPLLFPNMIGNIWGLRV